MPATIKVAISIQKALFDQAETLAQQIHIPRSRLFELALEAFIHNYPDQRRLDENSTSSADPGGSAGLPGQDSATATPTGAGRRTIHQGDIYWAPLAEPGEAEPGYTHPHVVIQDDVLNRSRIHTVVVCALTSNIKRAKAPGNVRLEVGEANLTRPSVVVVSQVSSVEKTQLGDYIGSLSQERIDQILAGMRFVQSFTERSQG